MFDIFTFDLIKYAFLTGITLSILCGFLSFFVVQKKMAFLSVAVSHSAFGAIALAMIFSLNIETVTYAFCIAVALIVFELKKRSLIEFETVLGIFFAFTMALGIIFLKFSKDSSFDLSGMFFGSIIASSKTDFLLSIVIVAVVGFIYFINFNAIIFTIFDEDVAKVSGINTGLINYLILLSVTVVIVASIKIVGIVLLTAFLTIPASVSLLFTENYKMTILFSVLFAPLVFVLSFVIAYNFDLPPGATTVVIGTLIYLVSVMVTKRQS